jgi:1,3-beta-glucanosyltransferase GAS1
MASIGTNSVRVYHVDPYENHDGCMEAFSNNGIYVWLDLDTFNTTINQTIPTWSTDQFVAFTVVMDVFQQYDNLAGFWIGNEVINTVAGSPAAPYIKAAVTDMKAYMAAKNYRTIGIGYSAADIAQLRPALQNYLACGGDPSESIDFFGLNSYEWCGDATYESSGYANLQAMAEGYDIPIFFSETGCNVGGPRTFDDQAAIFGSDMVGTWSGAIIYEWVQETNDYGLVTYGTNGQIYDDLPPVPIQPDYSNLAGQWATLTPSAIALSAYSPSFSAPACPASTAGSWEVNGNPPLPTLGASIVSEVAANNKQIPTAAPSAGTTPLPANVASSASSTSTALSVAQLITSSSTDPTGSFTNPTGSSQITPTSGSSSSTDPTGSFTNPTGSSQITPTSGSSSSSSATTTGSKTNGGQEVMAGIEAPLAIVALAFFFA